MNNDFSNAAAPYVITKALTMVLKSGIRLQEKEKVEVLVE